jgi:periplasmic divalent cation tolerance protein
MPATSHALLVLTNLPDHDVARAIARQLVENQLAACVNIMPAVQSIYQWQGQLEEAAEVSLLIKTTTEQYGDLESLILSMHPYDVPEVIGIPVTEGLPAYLAWLEREVRKDIDV